MYEEIRILYKYCVDLGLKAELHPMFDGYAIRFPVTGKDFIQHKYSHLSDNGCVEPAIGCKLDYSPVSLDRAKALVDIYKNNL